jgi:hypothetical protein
LENRHLERKPPTEGGGFLFLAWLQQDGSVPAGPFEKKARASLTAIRSPQASPLPHRGWPGEPDYCNFQDPASALRAEENEHGSPAGAGPWRQHRRPGHAVRLM